MNTYQFSFYSDYGFRVVNLSLKANDIESAKIEFFKNNYYKIFSVIKILYVKMINDNPTIEIVGNKIFFKN